jgi:hypothetical protein
MGFQRPCCGRADQYRSLLVGRLGPSLESAPRLMLAQSAAVSKPFLFPSTTQTPLLLVEVIMPTSKLTCHWIGFALVFLGLSCPSPTWGKTWIVATGQTPCATWDFTTVGAAITAAAAGDEIDICSGIYPEQLMITKPLTLAGIGGQGVGRTLIQPANLVSAGNTGFTAVITVMGTSGVVIRNLAIDASNNTFNGCTIAVAGIHFYDASGIVDSDSISGTALSNPTSCTTLFPGNGFGVQVDQDATTTSSFNSTSPCATPASTISAGTGYWSAAPGRSWISKTIPSPESGPAPE